MSFLKRKSKDNNKQSVNAKQEKATKSSQKKDAVEKTGRRHKQSELAKNKSHPASRLYFPKFGGFRQNKPTAAERQRMILQDKIPVKDVWNGCFVDEYGDLYPVFAIGSKNVSMLSSADLYAFINALKIAFISIGVESYQIAIVPMPFDLETWLRHNNKIKAEIQTKHEEIIRMPHLSGESDSDYKIRIGNLKMFNEWRHQFMQRQEQYVTSKLKSGQITTKRSYLIANLRSKQNIDEVLDAARTISNKFISSSIELRQLNSQEARSLLYVMLNPLSPEIVDVPRLSKAPTLLDKDLKVSVVLETEYKKDNILNDYTKANREEAYRLVSERERSLVGFDGKTQLGRPDIYPNAEKLGAPTDKEIEQMEGLYQGENTIAQSRDLYEKDKEITRAIKKQEEKEKRRLETEVRVERMTEKVESGKTVSERNLEAELTAQRMEQKQKLKEKEEALEDFNYHLASQLDKELDVIEDTILQIIKLKEEKHHV